MLVISSKEFIDNPIHYLDRIDRGEEVILQRGKNKAYSISPLSEDDDEYDFDIPEECLCDPFEISPSGDRFWADKRNVEKLKKSIETAEKDMKEGRFTRVSGIEELNKFLDSL